jgi:hypothetical protein
MTRSRLSRCVIAALVTAGAGLSVDVPVATAQGRVPRSFTGIFGGGAPLDPNRTRQEFTLTANLLAGYDDNLVVGTGTAPPTGPDAAGYLGDLQLDFEYFRGKADRSFTVRGGGHGTRYSESSAGFQNDASVGVSGQTRVRRRDQFRADAVFTYDSFSTLGTFEGLEPSLGIDDVPTSTPDARFSDTSSTAGQASLNYAWAVGRSDGIDLQYGFTARRYGASDIATAETPGDVDTHRAAVAYSRSLGRFLSIRTAYDYSNADAEARIGDLDAEPVLGSIPLIEHTITVGPAWQRQVSRTRRVEISASLGAQYVETVTRGEDSVNVEYWVPSGSATMRVDLGRTWSLWGDYNRGTTVLPQVTSTALTTDAVSLSTGGRLGNRAQLSFTTGWAKGGSNAATGGTDDYTTVLAGTQFQYRLNRRFSATATYSYYEYRFESLSDLPEGFPPTSTRNAVRVGVTIWLPLLGRYVAEPRAAGRF